MNEWPVWQRYRFALETFISHRTPPQLGQLYGTCAPRPSTCATSLNTRSAIFASVRMSLGTRLAFPGGLATRWEKLSLPQSTQ